MQPLSRELISWTHKALKHFYDLPFLERHCRASVLNGRFVDGHALQEALSSAVQQLRPPVQIAARSPAWRIYNVLNLRYLQGLTQSEVADHMNIGSRQLRREQLKATEAVAAMLFEQAGQPDPSAQPEREPDPTTSDAQQMEMLRIDELLRAALRVLGPLLQRQDLQVTVTTTGGLPVARANRMIARQVLISALNWWINGLAHSNPVIPIDVAGGQIRIVFQPGGAVQGDASPGQAAEQADPGQPGSGETPEPLVTLRQLAQVLPAGLRVLNTQAGARSLEITLPACETNCIVLIDDNQDAIQLARRYLHQSNEFYLVAVTRAEEAFHHVLALQPACILLDVMMPERDGWELLTLFKTHPDTASIPIIVSSVLKEDELALALGASAILPKPFTALQLNATLRSTIGYSRQTQAASAVSAPQSPASTHEPTDRSAGSPRGTD